MPTGTLRWSAILLQACIACSSAARVMAASSSSAEYAVRWDPAEGGPKTPADTLTALHEEPSADVDEYEVRYFDLAPPAHAPTDSFSILRQRVKNKKKHELTFKYRSRKSLGEPPCPLPDPSETKSEVDVSVSSSGDAKRVFSYSCTVESKAEPPTPPPDLHATPKACSSTMTRLEAARLGAKVEEWHLPDGTLMLEVSRSGADTPADLAAFKRDVVDVLLAAGAKPSDKSKTELGSDCSR